MAQEVGHPKIMQQLHAKARQTQPGSCRTYGDQHVTGVYGGRGACLPGLAVLQAWVWRQSGQGGQGAVKPDADSDSGSLLIAAPGGCWLN